jgi:hypothetical protein
MKITKMLEIVSGIFTFFLVLRISYLEYLFSSNRIAESDYFYREGVIVIIILALLVAIGAYLHTTKQRTVSIIGLVMIFICGGWLSFLYFVNFILGRTSNIDPVAFVLPGLFAITTVFLALANIMFSASEPVITSPRRSRR